MTPHWNFPPRLSTACYCLEDMMQAHLLTIHHPLSRTQVRWIAQPPPVHGASWTARFTGLLAFLHFPSSLYLLMSFSLYSATPAPGPYPSFQGYVLQEAFSLFIQLTELSFLWNPILQRLNLSCGIHTNTHAYTYIHVCMYMHVYIHISLYFYYKIYPHAIFISRVYDMKNSSKMGIHHLFLA